MKCYIYCVTSFPAIALYVE